MDVSLLQLGDPQKLRGDALANARLWSELGGVAEPYDAIPEATDVIVDAIFGTGLEREVQGHWASAINAANRHAAPVLALDIPSGLNADCGRIMGTAIKADQTISFIALKQGMFTGDGPELCGQVHLHDLELRDQLPELSPSCVLESWHGIDGSEDAPHLPRRRPRNAHKGAFGHVLVVGGDQGMSGAARLAGEAALRVGSGLITLATHPDHAGNLGSDRPELMCRGIGDENDLLPLLKRANIIVIGPGLGRSEWSRMLWRTALDADLPMVVDADALNLLAAHPLHRDDWILTPHPGEAGRLLGLESGEIQDERFHALARLQRKYGGTVVLKGAGTLIQSAAEPQPWVCGDGNPGMASGGMGDVLAGIIGGLAAQHRDLPAAARAGTCLHAAAGDRIANRYGELGMAAGDLFPELRRLLNGMP
jgi:NAD(P)H-hydrate epimerase